MTQLLLSEENPVGVFRRKADILVFAAVYGFRQEARRPLADTGEPIRFEVFERQGYGLVFNLIALAATEDATTLGESDSAVDLRSMIFEEYANGGLELLQQELRGLSDPLGRLLLVIDRERRPQEDGGNEEFDLSRFLPTG